VFCAWNLTSLDPADWHIISSHLLSHTAAKTCLKNKTIIFVGDSLTRYQYINLATWLRTGSFQTEQPRSEVELEWRDSEGTHDWNDFFYGTSSRLGCSEICDCHHQPPLGNAVELVKENRHFFDSVWDIKVSFYSWLGLARLIHGLPYPTRQDYRSRCHLRHNALRIYHQANTAFSYNSTDICIFLQEIISPLTPDVLILNQGHWRDNLGMLHSVGAVPLARAMTSATQPQGLALWKTTTSRREKETDFLDPVSFLSTLTTAGLRIFDAGDLTQDLPEEAYWDGLHFYPFVYRELNIALMSMMCLHFDANWNASRCQD
jgi:hypothetical protein